MRAAPHRRGAAERASIAVVAGAAIAFALSLSGVAAAAVSCDAKGSPPYGTSYGAWNLPTPPGTYNAYYSFWNAQSPYYARRREADGTIRYEHLVSGGGMWEYANCTNGVCTDVPRRTQLQNSNGASGWGWSIEAWNTTSQSNC
jgi:hypothetical protein